jgi:hypothetical protein
MPEASVHGSFFIAWHPIICPTDNSDLSREKLNAAQAQGFINYEQVP